MLIGCGVILEAGPAERAKHVLPRLQYDITDYKERLQRGVHS